MYCLRQGVIDSNTLGARQVTQTSEAGQLGAVGIWRVRAIQGGQLL